MKTADQIATEVDARARAERNAKSDAAHAGAELLEALWQELQPLQHRYDVYIDMGPRDREKAIIIHRGDGELATWTRAGRTLVFRAPGVEKTATDVEGAIVVTAGFLVQP
jgi:hypothetical protein